MFRAASRTSKANFIGAAAGYARAADQSVVNPAHDLDGVRRRALLGSHLHELAVFLLRLYQKRPFGGVVAAGLLHINMFTRL